MTAETKTMQNHTPHGLREASAAITERIERPDAERAREALCEALGSEAFEEVRDLLETYIDSTSTARAGATVRAVLLLLAEKSVPGAALLHLLNDNRADRSLAERAEALGTSKQNIQQVSKRIGPDRTRLLEELAFEVGHFLRREGGGPGLGSS